MNDDMMQNAILAQLRFGIDDIAAQMELIEQMARETAAKSQEAFKNVNLLGGDTTSQQMTAQQAKAQNILKEGEAKKLAIIADSEAKQQALINESATKRDIMMAESLSKQVRAQEKADAANMESMLKAQAKVDAERAKADISRAKAELLNKEAEAKAIESAARVEAINARTTAATAEAEVKRQAAVTLGESKITTEREKQALIRQQIAQKEAQAELAIIQKQMAEEKILYMQAREETFAQRGTMGDLLQRRTSWLISGGFVMGGAAALGGTAAVFKDVERDMTTIARISEDAAFNFQYMRDELQQLGVQYGMTWENVSDIAIRWSQAGYNMADTIRLTETALLALNTAELDAEYATQGLIAIMSQWQLTAEDLLPVIDKINKTACAA